MSTRTQSTRVAQSVQTFSVLPLTLPALPSYPQSTTHYLYLRPHESKNLSRAQETQQLQQLFVSNVPVDANERSIQSLFKKITHDTGRVSSVDFTDSIAPAPARGGAYEAESGVEELQVVKASKKRKRGMTELEQDLVGAEAHWPQTWDQTIWSSGSSCVVTFVDRTSADAAMKAVKKLIKKGGKVEWESEDTLGENRYKTHHALTYPDPATLTANINFYLTTHTKLHDLREQSTIKAAIADEDGFVTVTKATRNTPASLAAAEAAKTRAEERKKKESEGAPDFYRFQGREKRKAREVELKKRFWEDRKKVEGMREKRMSGGK